MCIWAQQWLVLPDSSSNVRMCTDFNIVLQGVAWYCCLLSGNQLCCRGKGMRQIVYSRFLVCSIDLASCGSMTPANKTYFTFSALSFQVSVLQQCLRALRDELCLLALMWHEWLMLLCGKLHSESSDTLNQFL